MAKFFRFFREPNRSTRRLVSVARTRRGKTQFDAGQPHALEANMSWDLAINLNERHSAKSLSEQQPGNRFAYPLRL